MKVFIDKPPSARAKSQADFLLTQCVFPVVFLRERRRMKFDLTDLRLFCEVVDAGSITAGAERSALALAAASTRIRGMEESLGSALLLRSRHGVTPTPAGLTLLKHARAMLAQRARRGADLGDDA